MTESPAIQIEALAKQFNTNPPVFEDLWLRIMPGEFVCVIGHSGCGKTTILNVLAGLDQPSAGVVIVRGKEISAPALDRAVIFQSHALLPWMTVLGNVMFAVRSRWPKLPKAEARARCLDFVRLVGLEQAAEKRPAELSGGMKQRVGIARALAIEPQILLMDEPFSALDALTRGTLQDEVRRLCAETSQTTFMITHDVDEAIFLADRIVLMTNGPGAKIAEIVVNTLPKERTRNDLHRHPHYYRIRNHLIEFLVTRSRDFDRELAGKAWDNRNPPEVSPGLAEPAVVEVPSVAVTSIPSGKQGAKA